MSSARAASAEDKPPSAAMRPIIAGGGDIVNVEAASLATHVVCRCDKYLAGRAHGALPRPEDELPAITWLRHAQGSARLHYDVATAPGIAAACAYENIAGRWSVMTKAALWPR